MFCLGIFLVFSQTEEHHAALKAYIDEYNSNVETDEWWGVVDHFYLDCTKPWAEAIGSKSLNYVAHLTLVARQDTGSISLAFVASKNMPRNYTLIKQETARKYLKLGTVYTSECFFSFTY
jgi:hypothetical protein